jgi:hypothetical protein
VATGTGDGAGRLGGREQGAQAGHQGGAEFFDAAQDVLFNRLQVLRGLLHPDAERAREGDHAHALMVVTNASRRAVSVLGCMPASFGWATKRVRTPLNRSTSRRRFSVSDNSCSQPLNVAHLHPARQSGILPKSSGLVPQVASKSIVS